MSSSKNTKVDSIAQQNEDVKLDDVKQSESKKASKKPNKKEKYSSTTMEIPTPIVEQVLKLLEQAKKGESDQIESDEDDDLDQDVMESKSKDDDKSKKSKSKDDDKSKKSKSKDDDLDEDDDDLDDESKSDESTKRGRGRPRKQAVSDEDSTSTDDDDIKYRRSPKPQSIPKTHAQKQEKEDESANINVAKQSGRHFYAYKLNNGKKVAYAFTTIEERMNWIKKHIEKDIEVETASALDVYRMLNKDRHNHIVANRSNKVYTVSSLSEIDESKGIRLIKS